MVKLTLTINGKPAVVSTDDPQMPQLYVLRNDIGLHGPRFGCGFAQRGACTAQIDGGPVRSCNYPMSRAGGKKVVTLAGLGKPGKPHPLQQAFIEERAVQCGYCINGMIMQAKALLDNNRNPDESQIRVALKKICADVAQRSGATSGDIARARGLSYINYARQAWLAALKTG